jgi:hypothetical protein
MEIKENFLKFIFILSFISFLITGAIYLRKNTNEVNSDKNILSEKTSKNTVENFEIGYREQYIANNPEKKLITFDVLAEVSTDARNLTTPIEKVCEVSEIEVSYYQDKPILFEKNNKFGLYIYAEREDYFEIAEELVNSNGGNWGYVLIPYNVKDYDKDKWSKVFKNLNSKNLIPIIQLWDVDPSEYQEQTKKSAEFLDQFEWPIRERYISVYNEMNDSRFWYGSVKPREYAKILNYTIDTYKNVSPNFFMMNGAFNVSAPSDKSHLDSFEYMRIMNEEIPGIFDKLDGWASHPYPQPNFTSSPYKLGRWGIRAYLDELEFLSKNLGVKKDLPVFITETGWAHAEGQNYNPSYINQSKVAEYFKIAYEEIWIPDPKVRAVTPFTIRYQPPHDHFSWIDKNKKPYPQFDVVKNLKKEAGSPPVLIKDKIKVGC